MKQQDYQTQRERQRLGLDSIALGIAILLYVFSTEMANYNTTVNEAWWRWKNILMFDFALVIFALRKEVKSLITSLGYEVIIAILINYFFDQYFSLKGWSLNDYVTVLVIGVEIFINKKTTIKN